ncbi:MAG: hypothetical protein E7384_08495 [Ruminococcaceae bacterium]|nr:hypothetical protein [Oscillospiraceae bacterium]
MKRFAGMLLLISIIFFCFGCSVDIGSGTDGYLNVATKNPDTTYGVQNGGVTDNNSPDDTGNSGESDLISDPTDLPLNTTKPNNNPGTSSESTANPTSSGATSSPIIGTESPAATSDSVSTSKPNVTNKPVSYPTVSPTAPPVITQGPKDYFILTLDNGGGGGYVYINQSVDSETGEPGATNVDKGWFAAGDYVSISAVPYEGCTFAGWKCGDDDINPSADYTFVMPERDYPLTAVFVF